MEIIGRDLLEIASLWLLMGLIAAILNFLLTSVMYGRQEVWRYLLNGLIFTVGGLYSLAIMVLFFIILTFGISFAAPAFASGAIAGAITRTSR